MRRKTFWGERIEQPITFSKSLRSLIAVLSVTFLTSCVTPRTPQPTNAFRGFNWTSEPAGANIRIDMHTTTSTGVVTKKMRSINFTTPYINPNGALPIYSDVGRIRVHFDYTVIVSKEGYESVRLDVSGSDIKGRYRWDLKKLRPSGATSLPQESPVEDPRAVHESAGTKWAVCVGISKYRFSSETDMTDLSFAADDASMFSRWLQQTGWRSSHVKCLIDKQATERNIKIALESWLSKANTDDLIVLYWAGHGFPDPEDPEKVYFACYDTDPDIPATGFRMDQVVRILKERNAKNVIVLADTCHAGKLVTRGERGLSVVPSVKRMQEQGEVPKGWIFMVSADTDRKAVEHSSWRNGAFTHCLLQGLGGKADGFQSVGAKDGIVTLGELRVYLTAAMPDETQKVLGVAKHPLITTSSGDPSIWNLTLQAE